MYDCQTYISYAIAVRFSQISKKFVRWKRIRWSSVSPGYNYRISEEFMQRPFFDGLCTPSVRAKTASCIPTPSDTVTQKERHVSSKNISKMNGVKRPLTSDSVFVVRPYSISSLAPARIIVRLFFCKWERLWPWCQQQILTKHDCRSCKSSPSR